MSNQTIKEKVNTKETEVKINKLSNNQNIKLIKGSKKAILFIAESMINEKKFTVNSTDSSVKNKTMLYNNELPFGIISSVFLIFKQ